MRTIAFLRGVNIGGRRVAMSVLRDGLLAAGCTDVATYVQSGNVVVTPPKKVRGEVAAWLGEVMSTSAGFGIGVVVRTLDELRAVEAANPYPGTAGKQLHVIFADRPFDPAAFSGLDVASHAPEHMTIIGRELYLLLPNGMGTSTLPVAVDKIMRRSDAINTARNWNTVTKMIELAAG